MAEIILYDYTELVDDGWFGMYEESFYIGYGKLSAGNIVPQIQAVPEGEEITVRINSVGGKVFDGWSIYNALKSHKGNIIVRIEGIAASIASIIAMAGNSVIICQAAMLMIHKPTIDPFWCGVMDAEDLKREAKALDQIQSVLNDIYKSKTGLDAAAIDAMINVETWITPDEAVTLGFANEKDNTITESSLAENAFRHIFKNVDAKTRAYANTHIKITKTMNVQESLKQVNETSTKTNTLLTQIGDFFKNEFPKLFPQKDEAATIEAVNTSVQLEDDSYIYYEGTLENGTSVYTDSEMTQACGNGDHTLNDGRTITVADGKVTAIAAAETQDAENAIDVEALTAENAELKAGLETAQNALIQANAALESIREIKSKYTPENRDQDFSKSKDKKETPTVGDQSAEARAERKAARNTKK